MILTKSGSARNEEGEQDYINKDRDARWGEGPPNLGFPNYILATGQAFEPRESFALDNNLVDWETPPLS